MNFVYVTSKHDKDKMLALGYVLMKEDSRNKMWVFKNKDTKTFDGDNEMSKAGIRFALSDTLTF